MIGLDASKEDFLKLEFESPETDVEISSIVIIPTGEIHDSGYGCMKFALFYHETYLGCVGGGCDVIHLNGIGGYGINFDEAVKTQKTNIADWSMDILPNGLMRLFTQRCYIILDHFIGSDFVIYAKDRRI